jgi:hypothetical protein
MEYTRQRTTTKQKHNATQVISTTYEISSYHLESHTGGVYSIQHFVITFVSDLRQIGGFIQVFRFSPQKKTDHHDITEILLKVALNTITPIHWFIVHSL